MKITVKDEVTPFLKSTVSKSARAVKAFHVRVGIKGSNTLQDEAEIIAATNQLQQSIDYNIQPDGVAILGANYAYNALEAGSPPGSSPNIYALKRWARSKGIDERLVYPIAKKIRLVGTRKYQSKSPKQISRASEKISKQINAEIDTFLTQLLSG